MDDLTFRRTVYADPFTKDPEVIKAAKQDPEKQAFWDDIRAMENDLQAAMNVSVPENLAEKLLLKQTMTEHNKQKRQRPWYLAIAASVALAAIVSVAVLRAFPADLANDALAHVEHMSAEVAKYGPVDMQAVNVKLASYNGAVEDGLGEIVSANYCYLNKIRSLHLIVQGSEGLLSLFVVPEEKTNKVDDRFSNEEHVGTSFLLESARIIVVGENEEEVGYFADKAKQYMRFSA